MAVAGEVDIVQFHGLEDHVYIDTYRKLLVGMFYNNAVEVLAVWVFHLATHITTNSPVTPSL